MSEVKRWMYSNRGMGESDEPEPVNGVEYWCKWEEVNEQIEQLQTERDQHKQQLIDFKLISKKQSACTHHHNGVSQYSPFQHAWKCDKCNHVKQDEG